MKHVVKELKFWLLGADSGAGPALNQAMENWRRSESESRPDELAGATRTRILAAVAEDQASRRRSVPLATLFLPSRSLALAAALPAVVLALVLGWSLVPVTEPVPAEDPQEPRIRVAKAGDEVVFEIVNGGTPHRVYKSSDLSDLAAAEPVATARGSFRDRLESESDLVFYRID